MKALNKQALREAANAANIASWGKWESYKPHKGARGYEVKVGAKAVAQHCLKVDSAFIAAANPSTVLALLDELEAAEERYEDMLRQARSFREAHDSASELIRKLERNKLIVKLPTTKLWAGKVACYEASEIIAVIAAAGIGVKGE
ncbi:ead/Ea22-like family protein [Escherichia coli]|uniref:ead/Ea22-like family protein n=1 Tax=Escherichia coli TaxID=562 RepID=UPI001E53F44D|nr:ead/Ea22-like family protein [Escherichia coli]MCD9287523.1 ead/Ea22-like family protein [Escherichia coli]